MYTCERCGAILAANTDQCAYCGTVSAAARRQLQADAARQQAVAAPIIAQQAIARRVAQMNVEQAAGRSLMWGVLSPFFVCLPFPSVLAVLAHNRARRLAKEGGVELPTRAKVGYWLALVSVLGFVVCFVAICVSVYHDDQRVDARKVELAKIIAAKGTTPVLDHDFACALAEKSLLTDGFAGSTDTGSFRELECAGSVRILKERAEMTDFKLRTSSSSDKVTATICFKHGNSWFVERTGTTSCDLGQ